MSKEAMNLALEALETERPYLGPMPTKTSKAITALREALAEQPAQQEPVAIALNTGTKQGVKWLKNVEHGKSLYTSPQPAQRTWVGLTDEEIDALHTSIKVRLMGTFDTKDIYRAVEQALKERT